MRSGERRPWHVDRVRGVLPRSPCLVDSRASAPCSFEASYQFLATFAGWSIHVFLCSAILLCCVSPAFGNVQVTFDQQFWCISQFRKYSSSHVALQCCCFLVFALVTVIGSSTCHLCSVAISGRKRAIVGCSTPLRLSRGLHFPFLD